MIKIDKKLVNTFTNALNRIRSYDTWTVFSDLMELSTCSLQKPFEYIYKKDVDKEFNQIIKKYNVKEQEIFPLLLGTLISMMEHEVYKGRFTDIAGTLFGELNLIDKKTGQFFTPQSICTITAHAMSDYAIKKAIDTNGYITLEEPSCGAGAMILSFATRLIELGYNPQENLLVQATDIDKRCVNMCFSQLSYYGLSATVIHGNTLTQQIWEKLYTPFYFFNSWRFKK